MGIAGSFDDLKWAERLIEISNHLAYTLPYSYQLSFVNASLRVRAMPKAIKGIPYRFLLIRVMTHLYLLPGVLIECDPSIKAIILKIDSDAHDYIVEDLDDQTLVIKESQLQRLKARLEEVCFPTLGIIRRWQWPVSVLRGCLVGIGEHAADAR